MTQPAKRLVLAEMIWSEVAQILDQVKVAVVPVGSCEQHGPNTTFTTDTERANEFCKLLAERVGDKILVYPPVGYGVSAHHMGFPGTVTLRVETMLNLLCDVAVAIHKHGIRKVLFVNGHGGNRPVMDTAIVKLQYEYQIEAYWSAMGTNIARGVIEKEMELPAVIGHACEVETSQSMYLAPWIVREDLKPGELHTESAYFRKAFRDGNAAWDWKRDASENGALGDARRASVQLGKKMTDIALDYFEGIIDEIIAR
jgi:creatinine amidohydrolase